MTPQEYNDFDLLYSWEGPGGFVIECKICAADDFGHDLVHEAWCDEIAEKVAKLRFAEDER